MFERLFSIGLIGTMTVRNRIVMPPMLTCFADGDYVSQRLIDYYSERAKGGVGLIMVEMSIVDPLGKLQPNQLALWDDKFVPGLRQLTKAIHAHGAKIAIQIGHAGSSTNAGIIDAQPVSASACAGVGGELPRELTVGEIQDLVEAFGRSAHIAKSADFDGVEIHCAHDYLIRQFLSPYSNKRTDNYGGDVAGRAKFAIEIMRCVRRGVGTDYPVWFRINGEDYVDGGMKLEESKVVCKMLEESGADAVSVTACTNNSPIAWNIGPSFVPPGFLVPLANEIKKVVKVPVIVAGRINTPELAEQVLKQGKADFIAMGRTLIADPELPNKVAAGRFEEIRKCIADNECIDGLFTRGLRCTVNASVGKEEKYRIRPTKTPRRVLVVGGGPGGMEAARITAMRGHHVILLEKGATLGGQLNVADKGPHKSEIAEFIAYLVGQINELGVRVELNREADLNIITEFSTDVVIIATGANPYIPDIPGATLGHVTTANDALTGRRSVGTRIVVIGGGRVGLEVAEFLALRGKKITVLEMLDRVGNDLGRTVRAPTLRRLRDMGVVMVPGAKAEEITDASVIYIQNGKKVSLPCDNIVLAVGAQADNALENILRGRVQFYSIGDCVKPRNILEAISEGADIALKI